MTTPDNRHHGQSGKKKRGKKSTVSKVPILFPFSLPRRGEVTSNLECQTKKNLHWREKKLWEQKGWLHGFISCLCLFRDEFGARLDRSRPLFLLRYGEPETGGSSPFFLLLTRSVSQTARFIEISMRVSKFYLSEKKKQLQRKKQSFSTIFYSWDSCVRKPSQSRERGAWRRGASLISSPPPSLSVSATSSLYPPPRKNPFCSPLKDQPCGLTHLNSSRTICGKPREETSFLWNKIYEKQQAEAGQSLCPKSIKTCFWIARILWGSSGGSPRPELRVSSRSKNR